MPDAPTPPPSEPQDVRAPPKTIGGILRHLGPGLIIAGSIVGSGELIATTATGAEAGFWLLWLIVIGCVIKVFTQVEMGRYTIISGRTAMAGLNDVPGPRVRGSGNWLSFYWLLMFFVSIAQLGGIVGGVGQALSISAPLTEAGKQYNEFVDETTARRVKEKELGLSARPAAEIEAEETKRQSLKDETHDDVIWAAIITVLTAAILAFGRYGLIQSFATAMVFLFTIITVVNLVMLQTSGAWAISWDEFWRGFRFQLTPAEEASGKAPLFTALATFGIIGVGATELIAYPYWCLEKGYARFTGPRDDSEAWVERARGWLKVLKWDAWCSMVVYTFATIAFYLLGAATLGRLGLDPKGTEMIRTLAVMYEPVFGTWAQLLFLFGAFAVLYSTFFVANAGHARVCSDALRVFGFGVRTEAQRARWLRFFSVLFPFLCLAVYTVGRNPKALVLASGVMQALMLPMLAGAALYYRYRRCHPNLVPGRVWDVFFWISAFGMLLAGIALVVNMFAS